jgi:DNA methyltransferase 1-associated protein 1
MAASAADVRSILSLPEPSSTPGPSQPKKLAATSTRKPEGISRELYSLIGPSTPSIAAQLAKPRLKQKPNFGSGGKVKWYLSYNLTIFRLIISLRDLRTFQNPARQDSLKLQHWVKSSTDPDAGAYNECNAVYCH